MSASHELEPEALEVWHRVQAEDTESYTRKFHEQSADLLDELIRTRYAAEHLLLVIVEMSRLPNPKLQIVTDSPFLAGMVMGAIQELAKALPGTNAENLRIDKH